MDCYAGTDCNSMRIGLATRASTALVASFGVRPSFAPSAVRPFFESFTLTGTVFPLAIANEVLPRHRYSA
jgi:hypothetical protein